MKTLSIDRGRLVKLLGMLGSAHDGERSNAGALADRLVKSAGMTWDDVVLRWDQQTPKSPHAHPNGMPAHWAKIDKCLRLHTHRLSKWETGFLESVRARSRLTERQHEVLDDILAKFGIS